MYPRYLRYHAGIYRGVAKALVNYHFKFMSHEKSYHPILKAMKYAIYPEAPVIVIFLGAIWKLGLRGYQEVSDRPPKGALIELVAFVSFFVTLRFINHIK